MRYKRFATFNCQGFRNKVKQMNIADDFCQHRLNAMMIQETHMQGHDYISWNLHWEKNYIFISPIIKTGQSQELV